MPKGGVVTHGHSKGGRSRTYQQWLSMRYRCADRSERSWPYYGGAGITVCDRWQSFENFLDDMGECPDGYSLDRENNEQGYFNDNCRWIPMTEQSGNRRSNRMIEFNGKTQTLAAWSRELGVHRNTLRYRLANWSLDRALT